MTTDDAIEVAVDHVGELLDGQIGLRPEFSLRGRLRRSIRDEVRHHGDDLDAYPRTLAQNGDMLQSLVNRVTVQESGFFRHPDHFEVLVDHVLPVVRQPVTIWSAGCANGQEAYSLAMVLVEQGIRGSVVATDLSTAALGRTASATYTTREIAGVSAARRSRFLVPHGDRWQVGPDVRSRVTSQRHNLAAGLPTHVGVCQVVFCRNVLIYFSAEHARAFLDRLADSLAPGAFLFLGAAESLWQVTDRFEAVQLGGSFVYQRGGDAARVSPRAEHRQALDEEPPPVAQAALVAAVGRDALASDDHDGAVVAFRKWVYLAPDDPMASLHLGLALEAGGHRMPARRAYGVSRAVLHRIGFEGTEASLGGYAAEELLRLLDTKQGDDR